MNPLHLLWIIPLASGISAFVTALIVISLMAGLDWHGEM